MSRSPEEIIVEPTRLRVVLHLIDVGGTAKFVDICHALGIKSGALSVHARRLEEVGVIVVQKAFEGRMPVTSYSLTTGGRRALAAHKSTLVSVEPMDLRG